MTHERFLDTGEFGSPIINAEGFWSDDVRTCFDQFNAQHWIDTFRAAAPGGGIDMARTAQNVGVKLRHDIAQDTDAAIGTITGLRDPDAEVTPHIDLSSNARQHERALTFGHELGHLFLVRVVGITDSNPKVERFCEFFGAQMALPVSEAQKLPAINAEVIAKAMEEYQIGPTTVLEQLMLADIVPGQITIDTSYGVVSNPDKSHHVRRHVICMDCATGRPHDTTVDIPQIPLFDFTDTNWAKFMSTNECTRASLDYTNPLFDRALNMLYGRWGYANEFEFIRSQKSISHALQPELRPEPHDDEAF